jgi:hypothetical protein
MAGNKGADMMEEPRDPAGGLKRFWAGQKVTKPEGLKPSTQWAEINGGKGYHPIIPPIIETYPNRDYPPELVIDEKRPYYWSNGNMRAIWDSTNIESRCFLATLAEAHDGDSKVYVRQECPFLRYLQRVGIVTQRQLLPFKWVRFINNRRT